MATLQTPDLSPEAIFAALSGLKVGGSDPFVDGEFQGGECRIFKISFKDQSSLSVRVYHPLWKDQQSILGNVHSEMEIFRKLESSGFRWVPRFRAASLTFDNPMLYPFMVLDWVDGATLQWKDDVPSRLIRDKVLAQLAEIQLSLISCTMEERSTSATDFFERRINRQLARARNGDLPGITEKDCLDQLALLPPVLGRDKHSRLFAMEHGDLKPNNIIVDENSNIKCIIDWGFAKMAPLVQAAKLPCFLWTAESAAEVPSPAMLADRQSYVSCLPTQPSQAAIFMKRWQGAEDVDFRMLYLESMSSKGMLASMASVGWKLPYSKFFEERVEIEEKFRLIIENTGR